ncbi:MAG: right-handed parallel beta-helix repeat-containing protein [Salinivirgaceae bacterium]|nr:right-handed parallel beta-helix repeat-containing protein [Salinivirgaceae bacterium]
MKKFYYKLAMLAVISIFFISPVLAINYYVNSGSGSNANTGLTTATAKQTIQAAADLTLPGDTVFIMNGTYNSTSGYVLEIKRSGGNNAYITYKAYPGHTPKITASGGSWVAISFNGANYIMLDGLELEGNNANIDLADATKAFENTRDGIAGPQSAFNTNGIYMGQSVSSHHLVIRNCKVHDFPGVGIGVNRADYVTVENNVIYNTSWYCMYACSGIAVYGSTPIDNLSTTKIIIRNNIVYNNKSLVPWYTGKNKAPYKLSDGNGIIVDANNGRQNTPLYQGRTLVENNVSYNNGGGGVHGYAASHVDFFNNTAYNNGTNMGYPEIDGNSCTDMRIYNNIMYSRPSSAGGKCNGNDAGAVYDHNIYYNGSVGKKGNNDIVADPNFVQLPTITFDLADASTADFRLQSTSPAINNGSNTNGQFSTTDILRVARPVGSSTDMGAYEYPTVILRAEMGIKQGSIEIAHSLGSYNFGDVSSILPKTVTFTIENIGDKVLNLTGTPKVVVTGTGYSVATDAPATVAANGSATFQVALTTTTTAGVYAGAISIANDDANENPYNFPITGYGYDGTKTLQTITFNAIPIKVMGDVDFDAGASSSAGMPITYTSSNTGVATIVAGKIHLVNAGTTTITASQAGDANTNVAKSVAQLLTVTPAFLPAGTNMITNPTFDANTTGWSLNFKVGAAATVQSVAQAGSATNVGKVNITNLGTSTTSSNIQLSTNVFVVKDRNYLISFKGSADANRTVDLQFLLNTSPWTTIFTKNLIALTPTPKSYGSYAFTSNYTGSIAFRFFLGANTTTAYFDDVEMTEVAPTNTNIFATNTSIKVYPNPAVSNLMVSFPSTTVDGTLSVFHVDGRKVMDYKLAKGSTQKSIDVSLFKRGIYFIILKSNQQSSTKFIVK